jgi:hypothetical protein
MLLAQVGEDFAGGAGAVGGDVGVALADALALVGGGGDVEEALVGGGGEDSGFGFAVDGEDDGAAGLLELLHHFDGVVAEGGEGLDVLGDVEHGGLRWR